tara:strand:- start:2993 stop:3877 length:885 start_codon:yes stop_codon:yes gene_type:complete
MRYLTSNDVAEILGVNISTLKRWTDNGTINCTKTAGGHRKFTMQHVRDYYKKNKNADKSFGLALERLEHKRIYESINKNDFLELATRLADASIESDDLSVSNIIDGAYMKGLPVESIFDKIVDPAANAIENSLRQGYLSHLETFISRKLITRHVETLTQNKPNGSFNGKSALCVNFEDNLPDLGVVMSEVVLRHSGYNVYNTGSHADLGNLKTILEKKSVDLVLFYLCDMQCCMATIKTNIEKTKSQINEINNLSKDCKIPVIYGGNGINFLLDDTTNLESTFLKYSDLKKIIS